MNQVATQPKPGTVVATKKPSMIEEMASHYNMDPVAFSNAVKKTAMPPNATNEEFAAFMMVAKEYDLNPFLRELYAFPKKGGGIVPMVSIDGWVNIINSNPLLAGFELETHFDDNKKLAAVTCRMHRKDRTIPTVVTEYFIECFRNTEPWRTMPHRMLRHKALIQAARYCFGLAGIYDEDEARDISGMKDVTPPPRPKPQDFVLPNHGATHATAEAQIDDPKIETPAEENAVVEEMEAAEKAAKTAEDPLADYRYAGAMAFEEGVSLLDPPKDLTPEQTNAWKDGWRARELKAKSKVGA